MKQLFFIAVALIIIGAGVYLYTSNNNTTSENEPNDEVVTVTPVEPDNGIGDGAQPLVSPLAPIEGPEVIGRTIGGRDIIAYHYGTGANDIVFIGGLHGGYSWNTSLLLYQVMDYFATNPSAITDDVRVTIIPAVNVDGLETVTGTDGVFVASDVTASESERITARFNQNDVDLNRNFACEWQATGTWRNQDVSGGSTVFSEPEAQAVRDYIERHEPTAVVAYYAAAGGVYSSNCRRGVLPETSNLTNLYATASGYGANEEFDFYEITGDMVNWLASENIPAISVLLTDRTNTELSKNLRGIEAIIANY